MVEVQLEEAKLSGIHGCTVPTDIDVGRIGHGQKAKCVYRPASLSKGSLFVWCREMKLMRGIYSMKH